MDVSDYKIVKWHRIDGYFIYLIETPLNHYAVVQHDRDDETLIRSQFEWDYVTALHTFNRWKEELYEEARERRKEPIQADSNLEEV